MRRVGPSRVVGSLVVAAAAATAVLAGPATAGAPTPTPPWMSHNGGSFGLSTTGDWDVHGAHVKARVLKVTFRPLPKANEAADRQGGMEIWAPTCLPGEQTIRLRRTVTVPGPLGKVSAALTPVTGPGFSVTSIEIRVNGQTLVKTTGRPGDGLAPTASKGSLFRFGQNTIELFATKAPNPKGVKGCNTSPATKVAVYAVVRGEVETDLGLIEPAPSDGAFARTGQRHIAGETSFTIRNNGRGGAARGLFHLRTVLPAGDVQYVTVEPPRNSPVKRCETVKEGSSGYDTVCYLENFHARTSYLVHVKYGSGNSKENKNASVSFQWNIMLEGVDTNSQNNQRSVTLWFCEFPVAADGKSCNPS